SADAYETHATGGTHVLTSTTALAGKWSGGWQAQHRQPDGNSASRQKRRPLQHRHQSPGQGSSEGCDHAREKRTETDVWPTHNAFDILGTSWISAVTAVTAAISCGFLLSPLT